MRLKLDAACKGMGAAWTLKCTQGTEDAAVVLCQLSLHSGTELYVSLHRFTCHPCLLALMLKLWLILINALITKSVSYVLAKINQEY